MFTTRICISALFCLLLPSCGRDGNADRAMGDSGAGDGATFRVAGVGFASPETVLWDSAADVYLVSNINGKPGDEDNNGFIARVRPSGTVEALKWIEGGKKGATLHGPKGMVISGDTLFAADVGGVRVFNRTTGQFLGTRPVATKGLNDLALGPDGTLYATDLEPPPNGGSPNPPPAAIYEVTPNGGQPVVRGSELAQPDGLIADTSGFVLAPFGTNQLFRIDRSGEQRQIAVLPGGRLDGLYPLSDGAWAVTSWDTRSVYRVDTSGAVTVMAEDIDSPAQLGIDERRGVMVIPSFNGNALEIRPIRR